MADNNSVHWYKKNVKKKEKRKVTQNITSCSWWIFVIIVAHYVCNNEWIK